jgi:hypothetical protein
MKTDVVAAHAHSSRHRSEIEGSEMCGCFHCLAVFKSSSIAEWIDREQVDHLHGEIDDGCTAICPDCGIDSVIGDASQYPITRDFLMAMRRYWF